MKKLFYLMFAVATIVMIGCTETEEVTGIAKAVEVTSNNSVVEGIIRSTINYDEFAGDPCIAVSYQNTTGYIQTVNVTDVNMPGTLSVACEGLSINPTGATGTGTLYIPINGSYDEEGEISMIFNITVVEPEDSAKTWTGGSRSWNVTVSANVYASDYELPDFDFSFTISDAKFLLNADPISEDDAIYVEVKYNNAWGRTVDFSLDCSEDHDFALTTEQDEEATNVKLANDDSEHTLLLKLTGGYASAETSFSITLQTTTVVESEDDGDGDDSAEEEIVTAIKNFTAYELSDLGVTDISWDSSMLIGDDITTFDTPIVISYENGFCREGVSMQIQLSDTSGTIGIVHTAQIIPIDGKLAMSTGQIEFNLSDLVVGDGNLTSTGAGAITVYARFIYTDEGEDVTNSTIVGAAAMDVYKFIIKDAQISGYLINGATSTDDNYIITMNYEGAPEGSVVALTSISGAGLVISDASSASSQTTVEGSGSLTFTLENTLTDARTYENLDPTTGYPYSTPLTLYLTIDGDAVETQIDEFNCTGMVDSSGFYYETIVLDNGQVWLDRNLGASSNEVEVPKFTLQNVSTYELDGSGTAYIINSDYKPNYDAYGKFHQRGQIYGFIMKHNDGYNPYNCASTTLSYTGSNSTLLANGVSVAFTESTPIQDANDPYILQEGNAYSLTGRAQGVWQSFQSSVTPSYTTSDSNILIAENAWNLTEDGGTGNPCPDGYRVPSEAELTSMIECVTGTSDYGTGNATNIPLLVEKMNLSFTGHTQSGGTTTTTLLATDLSNASATIGHVGGIGLIGTGTASTIFQYYYKDYGYTGKTFTTPPYMGRIALMMYDYETNNSNSTSPQYYVRMMEAFASTGTIEFTTNHGRQEAAPVRCILNCDEEE